MQTALLHRATIGFKVMAISYLNVFINTDIILICHLKNTKYIEYNIKISPLKMTKNC